MNNDCVLCVRARAHARVCVNNVFVLCVYMSIGIILL